MSSRLPPAGAQDADALAVLLVEDDPDDAELIGESLANVAQGHFALTWVDRLEPALALTGRSPVDVVLLDLHLPDSSGLATFRRLHDLAPQLPVVVLTGTDDDAVALQTVREGAQDYLVKGTIDSDVLWRSLRYAVERARS